MVFESAAPVGRLSNIPPFQYVKEIVDVFSTDRPTHANFFCLIGRNRQGHVVHDHAKNQVLFAGAEDRFEFLIFDNRRPMMGVNHAVSFFKGHLAPSSKSVLF